MTTTGLKIPKRVSNALMNSLGSGVVPRIGLEYIAVGRKEEIAGLLRDLEAVSEGGASCRFVIGRYGAGKSFILQLLRNYAMEMNFVVADADLSPERRLVGSGGHGRATYRELMHNFSTKTRPDGGALEAILERWISGVQAEVIKESGLQPDHGGFALAVETKILDVVHGMEGMVHGFDFARVLTAYWNGHRSSADEQKSSALRWLRGEFSTKSEARKALGVSVIVDDDNWYDYTKLMATFVTATGYKGLLVLIDEAVNLYKISHSVSRHNNYEKLLTLYNDTMQGKAQNLGILVAGTPQFLEDSRRGLYSYEALRSRLADSRFMKDGWKSCSGPIIRLETLTHEEVFVLLTRLAHIHGIHNRYKTSLTAEELQSFIQAAVNRLGAEEMLMPREIIRDFVSVLNIMFENPGTTISAVLKSPDFVPTSTRKDSDEAEGTEFKEFIL